MYKYADINDDLIKAVKDGDSEEVEDLISGGADVTYNNNYALRDAASNGYIAIMKTLIAAGADIHANNNAALTEASYWYKDKAVHFLIRSGADLKALSQEGKNRALTHAISTGDIEIIKLLLNAGAYLDDPYDSFITAVRSHNTDILKLLLEKFDSLNNYGYLSMALKKASERGKTETVKFLLSLGIDFKDNGDEAIELAAIYGNKDIVEILLEAGYDTEGNRNTVLENAVNNGDYSLLNFIISRGVNIDIDSGYALRKSIKKNRLDFVETLIRAGANLKYLNLEDLNKLEPSLKSWGYDVDSLIEDKVRKKKLDLAIETRKMVSPGLNFEGYSSQHIKHKNHPDLELLKRLKGYIS